MIRLQGELSNLNERKNQVFWIGDYPKKVRMMMMVKVSQKIVQRKMKEKQKFWMGSNRGMRAEKFENSNIDDDNASSKITRHERENQVF